MATTVDDFPNDLSTQAALALGTKRTGSIEVNGDRDAFRMALSAGDSITVEVTRNATGGLSDPYVLLFDSTGKVLAYDDEALGEGNARIFFSVPATGTYFVGVADYDVGSGGYSVGAYRRNIQNGTAFADIISGTDFPDTMTMGTGNDSFRGNRGDDLLDGGAGLDTVTCSGSAANYTLEPVPVDGWYKGGVTAGWVLRDQVGTDGSDLVVDVERVRFADGKIALDLSGAAGTTVKLLGAVFGKDAVQNKEYVGIGLAQLDGGTSVDSLTALALQARLGPNPSNQALVTLLYTNVVGVAPPASELAYYTGLITSGAFTQVGLTGLAAGHPLNLSNIGFELLVESGIGYT